MEKKINKNNKNRKSGKNIKRYFEISEKELQAQCIPSSFTFEGCTVFPEELLD